MVEFVDPPGCHTEGDTFEEAEINAREALNGWLESVYSRDIKIPEPSNAEGDDIRSIAPEPEIEIPILIRKLRTEKDCPRSRLLPPSGLITRPTRGSRTRGRSTPR